MIFFVFFVCIFDVIKIASGTKNPRLNQALLPREISSVWPQDLAVFTVEQVVHELEEDYFAIFYIVTLHRKSVGPSLWCVSESYRY